jgi:hypothetical protein
MNHFKLRVSTMTKKDAENMPSISEDQSKTLILRRIPRSLHNAVAKSAIDDDTTQQVVILRALKKAGFPVPDSILVAGRRRKRVEA